MSDQPIPKRTLLQKYDIPVEFLDFAYVEKCSDVKILEKIVKILRSGQEGFYPDLMKCAEEKLKLLSPDNKLFRVEEPVLSKEMLDSEKREQIDNEMKSWIDEMTKQDQILKEIKPSKKSEPPIRQLKPPQETSGSSHKQAERIKSTDYSKWDKFDADAAELKIDLDEERQREQVELKNKKNSEKAKLIEDITDEVDQLNDFESEHLSTKFREKGNECFKSKDYEEAIREYTQSLRFKRTAAAFNNRALVCKYDEDHLDVVYGLFPKC